jgi:GxxExxY protein
MPIKCSVKLQQMDQEQFHAIDKVVMKHVFDIHNTLGCFCDEKIYQEELAARCIQSSLLVEREVQLTVSHKGFSKDYFMDMLLGAGGIYELKAKKALSENNESQLINYLLLADLKHGKLINFRPQSVEYRFVSTQLSYNDRLNFQVDDRRWTPTVESIRLKDILHDILLDWGAFLDVNLYREVLLYFTSDQGLQPVDIMVSGRVIGSQKFCPLNSNAIWHLSTVRSGVSSYELHLRRLLNHTSMKALYWINLNHREITLKTLNNDSIGKSFCRNITTQGRGSMTESLIDRIIGADEERGTK